MNDLTGLVGDFGVSDVVTEIAGVPIEEYGDTMKIEGAIVGDGHKRQYLYLPGEGLYSPLDPDLIMTHLSLTEALAWLAQSDDPTAPMYATGDDGARIVKALVRKAKRQVDQNVAWKVYEAAGYACEYCGVTGVPLTYDHWLAQAYGGQTTLENGVSACRPCNKTKGHMSKSDWVAHMIDKGFANAGRWDQRLKAESTN